VPSLIVRFGDFFGPKPGQSWFNQALIKPGKPVTKVTLPGAAGVGHDWAYIPDAGETFAQLMDRDAELEPFTRFHFRGHWDHDGTRIVEAIRQASGNPDIKVKELPWAIFRMASPFNETLREMIGVRPYWRAPIELDNAELVSFLGEEPHTPWDVAMTTTLRELGCLR